MSPKCMLASCPAMTRPFQHGIAPTPSPSKLNVPDFYHTTKVLTWSSERKISDLLRFVGSGPELSVLPPDKDPVKAARHETEHGDRQADGVSLGVARRIRGQERECRNDTTGVAKADYPSCADATVRVAVEIHYEPAQDDRPAGKSSHGNEVDSPVLGGERVVDGHQDCKAGNGQCDTKSEEGGAKSRAIGGVSDYDGQRQGGGDGRYSM